VSAVLFLKNLFYCACTCRVTSWISSDDDGIYNPVVYCLQAADAKDAERGLAKFREVPRTAGLVNMSVMTTLYYCCLYHYELPEACNIATV